MFKGLTDNGTKALTFIQEAIKEGYSGNKIQSALQGVGLGYGRQAFQSDIRIIRNDVRSQSMFSKLSAEKKPKESMYTTSKTPMVNPITGKFIKFQTRVQITTKHKDTQRFETRYVTISHSRMLSMYDLSENAHLLHGNESQEEKFISASAVSGRQTEDMYVF